MPLQPGSDPQSADPAVKRQNASLRALHETALGLLDKIDTEELLETIIERAADLAGTAHGYIYLLSPEAQVMEMRVGKGLFAGHLGLTVRKGQGMGGTVWQTESPQLVSDYRSWPGRLHDPSLDRLRCIVGIPLKSDHQVQGVIGLAHVEPGRQFDEEDITVLERFAALALLALEKATLYSTVTRELAERKKAEARIRESERLYRSFLESSPDPIVVYNMQGIATYINPAFEQTFGQSRHELLGKQIDFVPEECWPETKAAIDRMLSGGKITMFETKRLAKNGQVLDVQISSTLFKGQNGRPTGNIVTLRDISDRKRAEEALQQYHDQLEELVQERTAELADANRRLKQQIEERKRAEAALRAQSDHLEEVNTALRVLLKKREEDKREMQENVLSSVKELVAPYLMRLKRGRLEPHQQTLIEILQSNLDNIISPFISRLSSRYLNFTPAEIRVANLIKEGKTNKEIAELLLISKNTVLFHRHHIRTKLGLKNKKINLRTHLLSYEE
ncbi:PAS domain S-box protein [uncultured Desulfosarcina sp.]|uniref:PAS domain S-box protein n=1 Tax=uncultured Desulfosarcina sp. TaxID=218289 RepID=UPI0029C9AC5A|nr:PAS domain S-box protein [uncultured Desulfosarcina sp.]